MNARAFLAPATLAILLLVGCDGGADGGAEKPKEKGALRFVNLTDQELRFFDGKGNARPQIPAQDIGPRRNLPAGKLPIKVTDNKDAVVLTDQIDLKPNVVQTAYVYKAGGKIIFKIFEGDPQENKSGGISVRVVNLTDQKVSAQVDGIVATPIASDLGGMSAGEESQVNAGTMKLRVTYGSRKIDVPEFPTARGEAYTLIVYSNPKGGPAALAVRNSSGRQVSGGGVMR